MQTMMDSPSENRSSLNTLRLNSSSAIPLFSLDLSRVVFRYCTPFPLFELQPLSSGFLRSPVPSQILASAIYPTMRNLDQVIGTWISD
ncbi:unnamed protein product [Linum trigynum]|uniref:Uncharacterized protein n=1 Tax=Linum trigynum TaxID=586398 RepID=A0AAV2E3R1_9ROSI